MKRRVRSCDTQTHFRILIERPSLAQHPRTPTPPLHSTATLWYALSGLLTMSADGAGAGEHAAVSGVARVEVDTH